MVNDALPQDSGSPTTVHLAHCGAASLPFLSSLNTNRILISRPLSCSIHLEHSSTSKHGLHLHLRLILALIQLLR